MDSTFSRIAENSEEIDKNGECMNCAEYYLTSLWIYVFLIWKPLLHDLLQTNIRKKIFKH